MWFQKCPFIETCFLYLCCLKYNLSWLHFTRRQVSCWGPRQVDLVLSPGSATSSLSDLSQDQWALWASFSLSDLTNEGWNKVSTWGLFRGWRGGRGWLTNHWRLPGGAGANVTMSPTRRRRCSLEYSLNRSWKRRHWAQATKDRARVTLKEGYSRRKKKLRRQGQWDTRWLGVVGRNLLLLKVNLERLFLFLLAALRGLRDFSSLTRDWTRALGSESAEF